jgi:UDP-glucose 4-epimerase
MGEPVEVRFLPARSVDIPRNVLDISRAKSELGWSPRKTLEAGIQQMLVNAAQRPPNLAGAASFLERLRKHG